MSNSRLIGDYPVIGIRPVIDGRRGPLKVRESLEDQTMNMAKSAAKLFTENLKYSNGEPVKTVISNTTIGGVGEAAACAAQFKKEGVDITLTVTPCWCYGAETMDMDTMTIKGVWGLNATERPGAVYLASVLATHAQKGLPAFGIYGHDVQDMDDTVIPEDVKDKLLRFGRAAVAAATMRGKSYLQIGSVTMGIGGSIISPEFIEEYLGMRVESVDEVEIIRRMTEGIYDEAEFKKALAWTKKNCPEGYDKNPDFVKESDEKKEDIVSVQHEVPEAPNLGIVVESSEENTESEKDDLDSDTEETDLLIEDDDSSNDLEEKSNLQPTLEALEPLVDEPCMLQDGESSEKTCSKIMRRIGIESRPSILMSSWFDRLSKEESVEISFKIEAAIEANSKDGKEKMFSISSQAVSFCIVNPNQDSLARMEMENSIAAVMLVNERTSWNAFVIKSDEEIKLVSIKKADFQPRRWKLVQQMGWRLYLQTKAAGKDE